MFEQLVSMGYKPVMIRGKPCLNDCPVDAIIRAPISYTRRRYSNQTFTWVSAFIADAWVQLGDPWPCVTPRKTEIERAIQQVIDNP